MRMRGQISQAIAGAAVAALAALSIPADQQSVLKHEVESFHRDGFLIKRAMMSPEEMALIHAALETDKSLGKHAMRNNDDAGGFSKVTLFAPLDNGTLGTSLRLVRFVHLLRALLDERTDVMHWMTRIIDKPPNCGGEWTWHQDFGYWRQDGFRRPDMMTVYLAVDNQTMENGPLRLLRGSHQIGVAQHSTQGSASRGVDSEQLNDALRRFPEEVPMLQSGDVMFIDSLLYHTSSGNKSPTHRRALTAVFTRADNVGDDGTCCRRVVDVDDMALLQQGAVIGVDAAGLVEPHGYVGEEARRRHGYVPWVAGWNVPSTHLDG